MIMITRSQLLWKWKDDDDYDYDDYDDDDYVHEKPNYCVYYWDRGRTNDTAPTDAPTHE